MNARAFTMVVAVATVMLLTACGGSAKPVAKTPSSSVVWPAPSDPMARARAAGLVPETAERLQFHVHSHLDVFLDGKSIAVPAGLGIDVTNPAVQSAVVDGQEQYGGISSSCDTPCISPLHTHDSSGILHTESSTRKDNTLGQLFIEWHVRLDASCVDTYCKPAKRIAVYVNGTPFTADPATIPLGDRTEIAIVIGAPPDHIPGTADWGGL